MKFPVIPIISLAAKLLGLDKKVPDVVKSIIGAGKGRGTDGAATIATIGVGAAVATGGIPEAIDALQQIIALLKEAWPLALVVWGVLQGLFTAGRKAGAIITETVAPTD